MGYRHLSAAWLKAARRRQLSRALRREGFTFREIADVLHVSPETVRKDNQELDIRDDRV